LSDEISSSSSKSAWGGARPNSGGARPNAGGARANSGGARPNSGGPRENSGGRRDGAGRSRKSSVLAVMPLDIDQWFCVRTVYGQAKLADEEARLAGFTVFNPSVYQPATKPKRDVNGMMRRGKPERVTQAFPNFFFVRLNLSDPAWHAVRRLPGVKEIMSIADRRGGPGIPIALPDQEIAQIADLCEVNDCIYPPGWTFSAVPERPHVPELVKIKPGTRVQLIDDPSDNPRTFICIWSRGKRLGFMMHMLGREAPTTVERSAVRIAA
jgi:transcription antitermination factor NusG